MILEHIIKFPKKKNTSTNRSESVKRSLLKTMSWRLIGTIDTIFISYLITGTFLSALSIGAFEMCSKMILYFFHERIWNLF